MRCVKNLFIFVFLFTFSSTVLAQELSEKLPVYENAIENIELVYEGSSLAGKIVLDNGFVMRIIGYVARDDENLITWQKGDVVTFFFHSEYKNVLAMMNLQSLEKYRCQPYVLFDLLETPLEVGLKVVEVSGEGQHLKLNDGSLWEFNWWNTMATAYWHPGQRVFVRGDGKENSYAFANIDVEGGFSRANTAVASFKGFVQ